MLRLYLIYPKFTNSNTLSHFRSQESEQNYGIDWDGPPPNEQWGGELPDGEQTAVEVPYTNNPLTNADYTLLQTIVNPLHESEMHGVDLYLETLSFIEAKVNQTQDS